MVKIYVDGKDLSVDEALKALDQDKVFQGCCKVTVLDLINALRESRKAAKTIWNASREMIPEKAFREIKVRYKDEFDSLDIIPE